MEHKWKERLGIEEKDVSMNAVPIKSTWIPCSMFPPTPAYFLSSSISLPPSSPPPPFTSLSSYLSACLFQDKNPTTVFKDRRAGREVDALVAKVMTTAIWSTQMHPDVTHTHTHAHMHKHIHLCCQHFKLFMHLSDKLFEDISEAMWCCRLYTGGHFKSNSCPEIAGLTPLSLLLIRSTGGALKGGGAGLFHLELRWDSLN